jgi:hypothetical protein
MRLSVQQRIEPGTKSAQSESGEVQLSVSSSLRQHDPATADPGIKKNMNGMKLIPVLTSEVLLTAMNHTGQKKHTHCNAIEVTKIM